MKPGDLVKTINLTEQEIEFIKSMMCQNKSVPEEWGGEGENVKDVYQSLYSKVSSIIYNPFDPMWDNIPGGC